MFIERIIYNRLVNGLQPYLDNPKLFRKFLVDGGISAEEAEEGRRYFAGDQTSDPVLDARPPHPIMGFAQPGGPFPAWAVTLGNENTAQDYLGEDGSGRDEYGEIYEDPETGELIDAKVRRWDHRYDVFTYVDHPDAALYYYELCKKILVSGRSVFQQADLDEITYQGAELAPDQKYLPPGIFVRRFSVQLKSDFEYSDELPAQVGDEEVTATLGVGLGSTVSVAIDDGEQLSEQLTPEQVAAIESIRAGVTTYFVGEDDG